MTELTKRLRTHAEYADVITPIAEDMLKAADEIERLMNKRPRGGLKMNNWISVRDAMPEDGIKMTAKHATIKVLVYIKNKNGSCVRTQTRMKNKYYNQHDKWEWGKFTGGVITHWMPLPEPPTETEAKE